MLGVDKRTLYAYASRGLVESAPIAGSRARRYSRADLDRLRARSLARKGHGAAAAGALRFGEPVLDSSITAIDPERGPMYRGVPLDDLFARGATFESVAELLWTGSLPTETVWRPDRLGVDPPKLSALIPRSARPIDALMIALPRIAFEVAVPASLVRRVVTCFALPGGARRTHAAWSAPTIAEAFLTALGRRPTARARAAVDRALIVSADHELNPSSFAARIPASVGATLPASIIAAVAALSGPIHGASCDRVEAMFAEARGPEDAAAVVKSRLRRGDPIPGFGHPLYPNGDPRTKPILDAAISIAPKASGVRKARAFVSAMSLASASPPTIDIGLVALASALRLDPGGAVALFAAGRAAGWIAHALEQRAAGFTLRPRARYVGEAQFPR
jgi:citrate synthase